MIKLFSLLKENGYEHYTENTIEELDSMDINEIERRIEVQLAIDWIRVNFGIHIETIQELPTYCCYVKNKRYDKFKVQKVTENFNTPEEAKEAALLYTLKNLIK